MFFWASFLLMFSSDISPLRPTLSLSLSQPLSLSPSLTLSLPLTISLSHWLFQFWHQCIRGLECQNALWAETKLRHRRSKIKTFVGSVENKPTKSLQLKSVHFYSSSSNRIKLYFQRKFVFCDRDVKTWKQRKFKKMPQTLSKNWLKRKTFFSTFSI